MELSAVNKHIPTEIILYIFGMTRPNRSPRDLIPDPFLPKLALLSKFYLGIARRELYSDVFLTHHGSLSCKDVVRGFLWALQVQPSLVDLVYGIHYGATDVEEDEIRYLSDAISRASHLLRLRVFGYDQDYSSVIRISEAIQSRHTLQEVEISTFSQTQKYSSILCGLAPFFKMLLLWPDIRSVIIHSQTIGWERSSRFPIEDAAPGSCARLKRFTYHCAEYWEDRHLKALARMAPELEELELEGVLTSEAFTRDGLEAALTVWSSTLRTLSIHFPHSERESGAYERLNLDAIIPHLSELEFLDLGSAYMRPNSLAHGAGKLVTLRLSIKTESEYAAELKDLLRNRTAIPQLKELRIWPDAKLAFDDAVDIYKLCAGRGVSLEIVGDYLDIVEYLAADSDPVW